MPIYTCTPPTKRLSALYFEVHRLGNKIAAIFKVQNKFQDLLGLRPQAPIYPLQGTGIEPLTIVWGRAWGGTHILKG